jgi:hypothetical protein
MKTCTKCNITKNLECFSIKEKGRYRGECKQCYNEYKKQYYLKNKEKIKKANAKYALKNQEKSKYWKSVHYQRNKNKIIHRASEWNKNNRKIINKRKQVAKYNISIIEFDQMLYKQNNKCAICQHEFKDTPCVDHNHNTGKVRGLLCRKCNLGIGFLKDNETMLHNAVKYLSAEVM